MNKCDKDDLYITDSHVFFFGSVFSNFYNANFTYHIAGVDFKFFCSEQFFMWKKAVQFNDYETAIEILEEKFDPNVCKQLGRKVKNYDDNVWNSVRYDAMVEANMLKFTQNPDLKDFLLDPRFDGKTFVEASPTDAIWGIKTAIGNVSDDESTWKGTNLLGKAIGEVRRRIIRNQQI